MKTNPHLSMNDIIGKHYIIVEVLAKDAFEILYLVRDSNRAGSLFILKELFFETFCSRENNLVIIQPAAQSVFYKQKKEIIKKVNNLKNNHLSTELKTFGYVEENNTVYTIMEYATDAKMSDYLEFETEILKKETTKKSFLANKNLKYPLLIALLLLIASLGFMVYQKLTTSENKQEDKPHPKVQLQDYSNNQPQEDNIIKDDSVINKINTTKIQSSIQEQNSSSPVNSTNNVLHDNNLDDQKSLNNVQEQNKTSLKSIENNTSLEKTLLNPTQYSEKNETSPLVPKVFEKLTTIEIKKFLDAFINSSAKDSTDEIIKFYDKEVEKYFKFNNITQEVIEQDKLKYNKKWIHREFTISDFKVLKQYQQNKQHYIHVQTTTTWAIANKRGYKRQGKSKGFMKLKLTDDGLKVVSIYGLN